MMRVAGGVAALLLLAPVAPASAAENVVNVEISNFRYCKAAPCLPTDQGYLRNPAGGPVPGTDNPTAIIEVPAGATVIWTYRDTTCDAFEMCPGHDVMIEDGTAEGNHIGMAKARSGETTITYRVTEAPGTLIRYFCNINSHDQFGQTGILRVV